MQKIVDKLKGKPVRHETKIIDIIHGSKIYRRTIYGLEVRNMQGEIQFKSEATTLSKLTTVSNARPEVVQQNFEHLKNNKFSDISKHDDSDIHIIVGLERLGKLKTGQYIRGEEK